MDTVINLRNKTCFSKTESDVSEMRKERLEIIIRRKAVEVYYKKIDVICSMFVQKWHEQKMC